MQMTGYPHGRPGYVVDHVKPLKRGGSDSTSNMQWQTKQAAKAKVEWVNRPYQAFFENFDRQLPEIFS